MIHSDYIAKRLNEYFQVKPSGIMGGLNDDIACNFASHVNENQIKITDDLLASELCCWLDKEKFEHCPIPDHFLDMMIRKAVDSIVVIDIAKATRQIQDYFEVEIDGKMGVILKELADSITAFVDSTEPDSVYRKIPYDVFVEEIQFEIEVEAWSDIVASSYIDEFVEGKYSKYFGETALEFA